MSDKDVLVALKEGLMDEMERARKVIDSTVTYEIVRLTLKATLNAVGKTIEELERK